jgi:hypothetical protein
MSTEEHHFLIDAQNIGSTSMIAKALPKRAAAAVAVSCVYNQSHCLRPVVVSGVAIWSSTGFGRSYFLLVLLTFRSFVVSLRLCVCGTNGH